MHSTWSPESIRLLAFGMSNVEHERRLGFLKSYLTTVESETTFPRCWLLGGNVLHRYFKSIMFHKHLLKRRLTVLFDKWTANVGMHMKRKQTLCALKLSNLIRDRSSVGITEGPLDNNHITLLNKSPWLIQYTVHRYTRIKGNNVEQRISAPILISFSPWIAFIVSSTVYLSSE